MALDLFLSFIYNINIDIDINIESEDKMMTVNELLNLAVSEAANLNHGETFLLRDLFKGYEWNRISRKDRLLLGTLFLNYVNHEECVITPLEKASSGQQQYRVK